MGPDSGMCAILDVMMRLQRSCSLWQGSPCGRLFRPVLLSLLTFEFVHYYIFFAARSGGWHVFKIRSFLPLPALTTEVLEPVGMRDSCFLVPQSKLHQLSTYYRLMCDPEPCHENQKVKIREASTFRAVCVLTVTIRTATSSVAFFACCCPVFEVKGNRWLERLDGLKAKDSMSLSTAVLESPRFFKVLTHGFKRMLHECDNAV